MTPAGIGSDWSVVDVADLRLWHGRSGPSDTVRRAESPGCSLLVLGHCSRSRDELLNVARQVGNDDVTALTSVSGSCVVIAARRDDVVVAGDLAGQRVVFHARTADGTLLLGSQASQLASIVNGSLSREWLATRLAVPNASDVWWTGTPWCEVSALRPGWVLHVSRAGEVRTRALASVPEPGDDLQQGGDLLGSALRQSVGNRVGSAVRPTVDLSGGWDSSTVAALAARVPSASVSAITLVVPGVDDVETATEVARHSPGLEHLLWMVPDRVVPFSDLDAVPSLDEPAAHAANASRAAWWLRGIAEVGSDLHLSGDGGDGVLLALPAYLGDLVEIGRLREFGRHVTGWASLRNQSPQALARAGLTLAFTGYRDALRAEADRLTAGNRASGGWVDLVSWLGHSRVAEWMTPDARALVAARLRRHADQHAQPVVPGRFGTGDAVSWLALNTFSRTQRLYGDLAFTLGVNHQAPYLDDEVVRACWSVRASVRTTPGRMKPLLGVGAVDVVPTRLTQRNTKGDYSAVAYRGLQRNEHMLREVFTGSCLADLGLVDETAVRHTIQRGAAGLPVPLGALDTIVSTEVWLRNHATAPTNTGRDERGDARARAI
ncbi:albusnodin/ikarugamycin family macrolactam cyclase [Actinosynnema sp. CS-041913]|uniref:albusnodin/ikarugamycin family macrolactam cyclase n=1 Tax=Actinosynnema sp. CS-041913 TaxID=3239917 RepID=UPI003D89D407